jgi:hypothetical protein
MTRSGAELPTSEVAAVFAFSNASVAALRTLVWMPIRGFSTSTTFVSSVERFEPTFVFMSMPQMQYFFLKIVK